MKKFAHRHLLCLSWRGLAVFWLVTMPSTIPASALTADYKPNLANGETMFNIGGCAACHMTPGQTDRHKLGGGVALATPFGTFYAPNISPDTSARHRRLERAAIRQRRDARHRPRWRASLSGAALHLLRRA